MMDKTQYQNGIEFDYKLLGQRGGWIINESGLYSLILSSKLPNAKKIKKWGESMEEWEDIAGYEGLYQVSNLGRVKSLGNNKSRNEKIIKPRSNKDGYLLVGLYNEGKGKNHRVHRLVAQAFINNPDNKPEVNHKDEDKTNNCVENLEWVTRKENINYGTHNERVAKSLQNHKQTSKPIYGINMKTNERIEFPSTQEAGRNGFNQGHVVHCLKGRQKSHKGYKWFYE